MNDAIRVNPAPVLTLWAAVVAERLGHSPDVALGLAGAVAGTSPLLAGVAGGETIPLLGRMVPVVVAQDGTRHAAGAAGQPVAVEPLRHYLARAFGPHLAVVRAAMEARAAALPPEELNRLGLRLYEAFRPDPPATLRGKGLLHLERIRAAAA
ncbi:hypothetical protein [Falsiroseomonas sp.]|uniref:hypothetical protein n=1 Tax=Falsiroseomonas sp. TaxID=2870721 RepID=UPI003565D2AC